MTHPPATSPLATTSPLQWGGEDLWLALQPQLPGFTVEVLPSIDSTNSELMRRARAGQAEPTLLVAELQTAGRGRRGRTWVNAPGDCLMYSLGLVLDPSDWSGLSLVVGLSIAESLQAARTDGGAPIRVKWPNDLWLADGRKLGGTLIETANLPQGCSAPAVAGQAGHPRYVIIGTGINVQPPAGDSDLSLPPAALQQLSPGWQAPLALRQLLPALVRDVLDFARYGFGPFRERFAAVDLLREQPVHLSDGTAGTAVGVAVDGALLVRTAQGIQAINSSEVSVRPQSMLLPTTPA